MGILHLTNNTSILMQAYIFIQFSGLENIGWNANRRGLGDFANFLERFPKWGTA
jgi:hypothetical protein